MLCGRLCQVRDGRFERVVRAEDVDIHDRFERIDGELVDRGEEVACCAGTGQVCFPVSIPLFTVLHSVCPYHRIADVHHEINAS